jgi:hypothetical protein
LLKLTLKLVKIDRVLRNLARPEEKDRDLLVVTFAEERVTIYIDLANASAKMRGERGDVLFGFLAKMAAGTRVECQVARASDGQATILGAQITASVFAKEALRDKMIYLRAQVLFPSGTAARVSRKGGEFVRVPTQ